MFVCMEFWFGHRLQARKHLAPTGRGGLKEGYTDHSGVQAQDACPGRLLSIRETSRSRRLEASRL